MLFNTPQFFWFFAIFFVLYNFVFTSHKKQLWLLLASSLVFYGAWNYAFIPLLVFSALSDYVIAGFVERNNHDPVTKKRWLMLSIFINLSVLGIFKYSNFVLQSTQDFIGLFGVDAHISTLSIILPVGISFYTFQSMSYTIDVYRGNMKAHRGFLTFLSALSFFPQLVAGPILRAQHILPQLDNLPIPTMANIRNGLMLIMLGLIKKTMADMMAGPASTAFDATTPISSLDAWVGALAFSAQIYGDFSGYTDIAIGIALLMGFHIPINFNLPYFSSSPVDFWRRWHISLSSWLRDYLYISVGGNRNGNRTRNVFITMLLGGLWHGAAWTFVIWGAWHGFIISVTHWLTYSAIGRWVDARNNWLVRIFKVLVTFYLIVIGWVFFRATGFDNAWTMLTQMHMSTGVEASASSLVVLGLVVAGLVFMHLIDWLNIRFGSALNERSWLMWPILVVGFSLFLVVGDPGHDFIYFQF
jgi:D-alanyl-lipoteichoic acid acyltransferase DltB (MBOAT superfamily)